MASPSNLRKDEDVLTSSDHFREPFAEPPAEAIPWLSDTPTGRIDGVTNERARLPTEKQTFTLLAQGQSSQEIADSRCDSLNAIDQHVGASKAKVEHRRTADLIRFAIEHGL